MPVIRRLLLTYLSLTLVVLAGLALPFGYVYQRGEQQHALAQLEHDAETLAAFIDTALRTAHENQIGALVHDAAQRWTARIDLIDAGGRPVITTRTDGSAAPDLSRVLASHTPVISGIGDGRMTVAVPIHPGRPSQGALQVSVSSAPLTARIHQFHLVLAGVSVAVLICGALIALALARWIGRPVRELERATRRLADGATTPAPATTGPPELRRLAETFNVTAVRLQELIAAQRSFVGHASHQLKTPLTALRLRLENLEPDITAGGEANLRAALREADRLATLVDTLLAMTRSEHRTTPCEPVTISATVAARAAVWGPVAEDRGVTLTTTGPGDVTAQVIPGALEQILDNLIANALDVAPPGTAVTITWHSDGATAELHVIDAGPGLSDEHRAQALRPFWRAPDARQGGTGLGLALVEKLAEAGGGRCRLDGAEPTGIDAVVALRT
ncbi:HAMP domain-containing sensor histidine kinase [Actinoplanes sp. NEAU-A12]|uniref:histidine kinase n=1 Tax=Actinoplanes sandaracinus TaxID=3045177 RepID=A0ABT6X0Q8_9ACTN|nr:HAMP domain-containing sensor histidine kinase [Actinoplanes sandaracinus]MDI6105585.1 HAMP domain-containing sensor histidine kinase [Actinoplanes sandaracinus]